MSPDMASKHIGRTKAMARFEKLARYMTRKTFAAGPVSMNSVDKEMPMEI